MATLSLGKSDLASALFLAHAANAAYCDNPRQQYPRFAELALETTLVFASRPALDTFGFVAANEAHLVLAFRGTDEPLDWTTNLSARMVSWDQGLVHKGFADALESVWSQVEDYVGQLHRSQQVWVCGHSLGGALATLASQRLKRQRKPVATYTFGQPRVGDAVFKKRFRGVLKRFVNHLDIAPHLPPRDLSGYQHVGELRYLDAEGQLHDTQEPSSLVDLDLALAVVGSLGAGIGSLLVRRYLKPRLEDHGLDRYLEKIERLV